MKLNNEQKRDVIFAAAERIASGKNKYTCVAIDEAFFEYTRTHDSYDLVQEYADFYEFNMVTTPFGQDVLKPELKEEIRDTRILMLLLFAEAELWKT